MTPSVSGVTIACTDVNGVASSAEVLAAVLAKLQSLREVNFRYFAVKPHYWKIDVSTTVYAWPGMGYIAVQAVAMRDYQLVMATAVMGSVLVVVGSLIADVLHAVADPRVRIA